MAAIETVYQCRIDFRWTDSGNTYGGNTYDISEAVMKRSFDMASREPTIEIEAFTGGAACYPYIELESSSHAAVGRLAGKIERYINRRKDVELME